MHKRKKNTRMVPIIFCALFGSIVMSSLYSQSTEAQLFDAIGGHFKDLQGRFSEHQFIEGQKLKSGQIDESAKGQDLLHNSSGTWSLLSVDGVLYLQSSKDFASSPGPDYHIYVSSKEAIEDNDQFTDDQIEVGRLKKPNGAAFYRLKTQDPTEVQSVLIWCKQFKEFIGAADLR